MLAIYFLSLLLIGFHHCGVTLGVQQEEESHHGGRASADLELPNADAPVVKLRLPVSRKHMHELRAALNMQIRSKEANGKNEKGPGPLLSHNTLKKVPQIMAGPYRHAEVAKGPGPLLGNKKVSENIMAGPYRQVDEKGPDPSLSHNKNENILESVNESAASHNGNSKGPGPLLRDSRNLPGNSKGPGPLKLTLILETKKTETLTDNDVSAPLEFSVANSKTETLIGERPLAPHSIAE